MASCSSIRSLYCSGAAPCVEVKQLLGEILRHSIQKAVSIIVGGTHHFRLADFVGKGNVQQAVLPHNPVISH